MNIYGLQWDTVGALPFTANLHAYYVNGRYATRPVMYGKGKVWVDVIGDAAKDARWLDVENEDANPAMIPGWLDEREPLGEGGIYCNRATLPTVLNVTAGRKFDLWLATLDGTVFPSEMNTLPDNVTLCCVQAFPAGYLGMNADISVVVNEAYWKGYAA